MNWLTGNERILCNNNVYMINKEVNQIEKFKMVNYFGANLIVGTCGTVICNGKCLHHSLNSDGYIVCSIKTNKGYRSVGVHRLVAIAFIDNPNNYKEVNHKDFNRQNPCVENLEWINHADNIAYSKNAGRYPALYGNDNPNYGNHKLSQIYAANHSYCKEKQSRPGSKNGRCVQIDLFDSEYNFIAHFDYIAECLKYIKEKDNIKSNIESMRGNMNQAIREYRSYRGYYFKKY